MDTQLRALISFAIILSDYRDASSLDVAFEAAQILIGASSFTADEMHKVKQAVAARRASKAGMIDECTETVGERLDRECTESVKRLDAQIERLGAFKL
jgi:hypothetical protein